MRNVNGFTTKFWPFFKDEKSFLEFIKSNNNSGYMWMDHQGWQVVANMYQINIHILTTSVMNMKEPRARWTHITPDERLSTFSEVHKGLPDMWLIHSDETHFDLLVKKESELVKEGSIEDMVKERTEENIASKISCNECKQEFQTKTDLDEHRESKHRERAPIGPGYMGLEGTDELENKSDVVELNKTVVSLIENYSEIRKEVKKQGEELKELKVEYKKVLNTLRDETIARTKAETLVKVLQETMEAKDELEKLRVEEDMDVEEMNYEEVKWQKQRSEKRKLRKRNREIQVEVKCSQCFNTFQSKSSLELHEKEHVRFKCETCDEEFSLENELREHMNSHEEMRFQCKKCAKTFKEENSLREHLSTHYTESKGGEKTAVRDSEKHEKYHTIMEAVECSQCEQKYSSESELKKHLASHVIMETLKCYKCDKEYDDMKKLRRHDWRSHRTIECNMCGDILNSRQDIKEHKQSKHRMFRRIICKFFPNCYDEDECLYEHENLQDSGCAKGENCSNQDCEYNENQHKDSKKIACRFQEKCNRRGCQFQHRGLRQAFLGLSPQRNRKM